MAQPPIARIALSGLTVISVGAGTDVHAHLAAVSRADLHGIADAVVVADIIDTVVVDRDDALDLYSRHTVVVREVIAGAVSADVIVVTTAGGSQGAIAVTVEDEPVMQAGSTMVLFVALDADNADHDAASVDYAIVGGPHGAIVIDGTDSEASSDAVDAIARSLLDPTPLPPTPKGGAAGAPAV